MEQKDSKIFNKETLGSVESFCKLNNIEDKEDFIYLCFKQGFDIKKFGFLGETLNEGEKHLKTGGIGEKRVEIEVIREIRVEVPVEKIVERIVNVTDDTKINELLLKIQQLENRPPEIVEVVKEVPVDRVVEKIIYTTDNIQINELGGKIAKLEQEISTKTSEMENIFQNKMSKKDEELDELRRNLDIPVTNNKINMLQDTLQNLRNDLSLKNDKINELEKINQELQKTANLQNAIYMKGSNLNSRI
jgi:predicted RNase H-like nuclease (RuvC/YqgF family)